MGRSYKKTSVFGGSWTEHFNEKHELVARSYDRTDIVGHRYTETFRVDSGKTSNSLVQRAESAREGGRKVKSGGSDQQNARAVSYSSSSGESAWSAPYSGPSRFGIATAARWSMGGCAAGGVIGLVVGFSKSSVDNPGAGVWAGTKYGALIGLAVPLAVWLVISATRIVRSPLTAFDGFPRCLGRMLYCSIIGAGIGIGVGLLTGACYAIFGQEYNRASEPIFEYSALFWSGLSVGVLGSAAIGGLVGLADSDTN